VAPRYCSPHSGKMHNVQCNEEIGRLEAEQAKAMKVMIQVKSSQIARLCEETCLPVPNLGALVDGVESPGQVRYSLTLLLSFCLSLNLLLLSCSTTLHCHFNAREVKGGLCGVHRHAAFTIGTKVKCRWLRCSQSWLVCWLR
jgi:hypothetical protein